MTQDCSCSPTKILTLKSSVLLIYIRFHKIHILQIENGRYSCLSCYPRTCRPWRVPEIECRSKFSSSKSYQAQTSYHETERYGRIAPSYSPSNILATSDPVKSSKTKNPASTKKDPKTVPTTTKRIQKRPAKPTPAKGLETDSESEDFLDNEVDEENALAELEQQQGHIQGSNEEDQVLRLVPNLSTRILFSADSDMSIGTSRRFRVRFINLVNHPTKPTPRAPDKCLQKARQKSRSRRRNDNPLYPRNNLLRPHPARLLRKTNALLLLPIRNHHPLTSQSQPQNWQKQALRVG